MNKIKFTKNWNNKLDCDIFSTIRKSTPSKYKYYMKNLYKYFEVELAGHVVTAVKLIYVKKLKWQDIPPYLLMLDTGEENFEKIIKIFKSFYGRITINDLFLILLFKRIK